MLDIFARSMFIATGHDGYTEMADDRRREHEARLRREEAAKAARKLRRRPLFWL